VGCGSADELNWRISKQCDGGACVEIATQSGCVIVRRKSKDLDGRFVTLSSNGWNEFLARVKSGEISA
jgi:hypothetical protein